MDSIRTSSLFHFTGKLENLKKILFEGLKPNFCKEDLCTQDYELIIGIPMVSFCDIPLTRITNFTNRYNEYAIGFSKEWADKKGVNPVLYANNQSILNSFRCIKDIQRRAKDRLQDLLTDNKEEYIESKYVPTPQAPYSREFIRSIADDDNLFYARTYLFGFSKKFNGYYKGKQQCNYDENEWRYIVKESLPNNEWLWFKEKYENWRGDETKKKTESIFSPLKFATEDINFIILRDDNQIARMIDYIDSLETFGGGGPLEEKQKKELMTKIISIERIKKDF